MPITPEVSVSSATPGETQVANDVSREGDERIGHRCVEEQHRG